MTYKRCVILLADGARADCFEELLAAGRLPHIKRHLVARGASVRGVTAFPSTTGPAYLPFLTGCLPATCNVPGIRWVDKRALARGRYTLFGPEGARSYVGIETFRINGDMRPEIGTLFQLLPRSYSIFNSVCRGIRPGGNRTRIMRIWYWYYAHLTDRWQFVDSAATDKLLALTRRDFQFAFVVFPAIDEYAHATDPRHPRVLAAYEGVDQAVGLLAERLQRLRRYDDTLIWIVSDHGLSATKNHFCVNTFLEERGIRTLYYPLVFKRGCVAANMMSGNGMTHLYFRHPDGWEGPMDATMLGRIHPGLLAELTKPPAVDLLAAREADGSILILNRRGRARLRLEGDWLKYEVDGADPFGYGALPLRMRADEQLQHTIASDYPDGLYQLAHIFTSPRTGDVVLSAAPGFDLRDAYEVPEHRSSHGSLHRDHMCAPIICSAPLPTGPMRTVDVFPLLLTMMGRAVPQKIDGRALF